MKLNNNNDNKIKILKSVTGIAISLLGTLIFPMIIKKYDEKFNQNSLNQEKNYKDE